MKRLFFLVMSVLLPTMVLATASSCKSKTTSASEPAEGRIVDVDTLVIEQVKDSLGWDDNSYSAYRVYMSIAYPVSGPLCDVIREYIAEQVLEGNHTTQLLQKKKGTDFVAYAKDKIYDSMVQERRRNGWANDNETPASCFTFRVTKLAESRSFVSLRTRKSYSYFNGSINGDCSYDYITVSKQDGIFIRKVVNEGYIRDLQPLLIKGFAQWSTEDEDYAAASESEVREYLSMGMWGFVFPEDELIPIDNNIMTEDGVLFSYKGLNANPTFTIPYEQILPYLTDEALELYQTAF
ncbi:MAG: hypothetical protein IKG96_09415 [Bacteroidaceae bacterium]|nr:hypothetical protein [Bacteroidaceae bacterium]